MTCEDLGTPCGKGMLLASVRYGSKAELHDTPKAAVQGAGIGEKSARQGATPDPERTVAAVGQVLDSVLA